MRYLIPVIIMAVIAAGVILAVLREAFREFDRGPGKGGDA